MKIAAMWLQFCTFVGATAKQLCFRKVLRIHKNVFFLKSIKIYFTFARFVIFSRAADPIVRVIVCFLLQCNGLAQRRSTTVDDARRRSTTLNDAQRRSTTLDDAQKRSMTLNDARQSIEMWLLAIQRSKQECPKTKTSLVGTSAFLSSMSTLNLSLKQS